MRPVLYPSFSHQFEKMSKLKNQTKMNKKSKVYYYEHIQNSRISHTKSRAKESDKNSEQLSYSQMYPSSNLGWSSKNTNRAYFNPHGGSNPPTMQGFGYGHGGQQRQGLNPVQIQQTGGHIQGGILRNANRDASNNYR